MYIELCVSIFTALRYLVVSTRIRDSLRFPKRQNRIAAKCVGRHTADALLDAVGR